MSKVFIYDVNDELQERKEKLEELKKIVADAIAQNSLSIEGKTVLVKPNMLGAFDVERGATTDPLLIEAIVRVLEEKRAKEIYVGDSPGGAENGTENTAKKCGIYDAACGHFYNFGTDVKIVPMKSRFIKKISIPGKLDQVDVVINVPKLKTHGYMGFSGSIKNMFGIVIGPYKAKMHFRAPSVAQFGELMVDIFSIRVPDLNIIDGIVVMEGDGPTSGPLRKENMIIAGTDGAAVDTVLASIMSFEQEKIKYLTVAKKRNLGETDLSKIEIVGPYRKFQNFTKPVTYTEVEETDIAPEEKRTAENLNTGGLSVLHEFGRMVPKLTRPDDCSICGTCAESCPAQAINMNEGLPQINYKKCISCYCCAELCHNNCYDIWNVQDKMDEMFGGFIS